MERLSKCPLCKSGLFLNHSEVKDFSITQEKFILCKCNNCQLVFTNPRPEQAIIERYYQSDLYISHQDKTSSITDVLYKQVRNRTIKQKVKWLETYNLNKGTLLDIGCGTGYFLEEAKKSNWKTTGIEPNKTARKISREKGLKVFKEIEELKGGSKFNAITLFHVLEHIHDLRKTGKNLKSILEANGRLFIAVPNIQSKDAQHYGTFWAGYDVPRHLYHFTQNTINSFAEEIGFKVIATEPMVFDSYYVSLLSESYINPKANTLTRLSKAFLSGLISNKWAKKNNQNYSSILFILKKK